MTPPGGVGMDHVERAGHRDDGDAMFGCALAHAIGERRIVSFFDCGVKRVAIDMRDREAAKLSMNRNAT